MADKIRVEVDGLGTLEFPDGTDVAVIDRTVKREIAAARQSRPPAPVDAGAGLGGGDRVPERSPSDLVTGAQPERRSTFARGVDTLTTPLLPQIGRGASRLADAIDTAPNAASRTGGILDALKAYPDVARRFVDQPVATARGFAAGAVEGAGQVVSQLTAPLDAVLTATGVRSVRAAGPLLSRLLDAGGNAALALRGGERVIDADDSSDAGAGLLQAALGAAGAATVSRQRLPGDRVPAGNAASQTAIPTPGAGNTVTARVGGAAASPSVPAPAAGNAAPVANPARRRELLNAVQARDAAIDPARMNDLRLRAETGEILTRPITAGPRVIEGLTRRPSMASEASPVPGASPALDALPAVRAGLVSPQQAGFLRWLADDLAEHSFERGGTTQRQRSEAAEAWRPGDPEYLRHGFGLNSGHVAGTPTLDTFNALGVDASRTDISTSIENLLQGKPGGGATDAAALKYADAMAEAWDGNGFTWANVSDDTLQRIGLRSRKDLRGPRQFPEAVFEGQGPETREYFAPGLRDEADGPIPDQPTIIHGLQRRRPAEDVRTPQPMRDPLADVEPFVQRLPEALRPGVRQVLADNGGFADQRRQAMPFGLIDRLSRQLEVDASRTLPKGAALNAESLRAYANAVATTGDKVKRLTEKVNAAAATDADLVALEAARAEHLVVTASMMGARSEAGRALSSFRMFSKVLETGDAGLIRAALKAPGTRSNLNDLAKQLAAVGDDPIAQYQFLAQQAKPSFGDKFRSYYYANILSGLKTHERNFLGNAFNSLTNLATVPIAGAVDALKSRATGQPRTIYAGELPAQVMGGLVGTQRGLRDFVFTLRNGISPRNLSGTLDAARGGQFDMPRVELGGGGANPFNWPGRMLDATDSFFRSIARNQEFYGLTFAQAKREGLTGAAAVDRIAQLKVEDSPLAQQLQQQADQFSSRAVFQDEPGKVTSALLGLTKKLPALSFVIPFVRTPGNIMRQGMEFSPAGAVMKGARQPGRQGSQAQARVAMGTMMLAPLAWLASTGRLSGSGPQDPAERAGLMEAGWRPNAVKLALSPAMAQKLSTVAGLQPSADGEYWVSYSLFQPVSVPASVVANAFESWKAQGGEADGSLGSATKAAMVATMRTGRSVLDQSYLSGLFDLQAAIDNPDQWAQSYFARLAHSMTPFAGAQRTVQQGTDATVRRPKGFDESVKANIPGLSQQVPPRIDRFGEDVVRPGNALARGADPFNTSPVVANPVAVELQRLGVDLTLPSTRIDVRSGRELTREEQTDVQRARGREVSRRLSMLLTNPAYQRLDDNGKRRAAERVIEAARTGATRQLKGELQ